METIFTIIMLPMLLLNMLGGIVSGIWLIFIGEWRMLLLGVAIIVGGNLIASIALMPGMVLTVPGMALHESGGARKSLAYPLLFGGILWIYLVMSAWAIGAFIIFMRSADSRSWIPLLIWSYGVATAQWTYMAQKETDSSDFSVFAVMFLQIAYLVLMVMVSFFKTTIGHAIIGFLIVMGICFLLHIAWAFMSLKTIQPHTLYE